MARLDPDDAARLLAAGRLGIGTVGWASPGLAARAMGLTKIGGAASLPFVLRLFASRDLALGVGLLASEGRERDHWLVLGMVSDAGDAVAAGLAGLRRQIPPMHATVMALAAVLAVGLGSRARGD